MLNLTHGDEQHAKWVISIPDVALPLSSKVIKSQLLLVFFFNPLILMRI